MIGIRLLTWVVAASFVFLFQMAGAQPMAIDSNGGEEAARVLQAEAPPPSTVSSFARGSAPKVLIYTNFLDNFREVDKMVLILDQAGFDVTMTPTSDPAVLEFELRGIDCLLIPETFGASIQDPPPVALRQNFERLSPVIQSFVRSGHNVVVCEGDRSSDPGEEVINGIGIAEIDWVSESLGLSTLVVSPEDCLVQGLATVPGANGDGSYADLRGNLIPVVTDLDGNHVVSRTTFGRGNFSIVGFDYFSYDLGVHDVLLVNACSCVTENDPRTGSVNEGVGTIVDVLFLNGTSGVGEDRLVEFNVVRPFELRMRRPPSVPFVETAPYALYVWIGNPTEDQTTVLPRGIGTSAVPMPITGPGQQPLLIWNNAGRFSKLGIPTHPSLPAPGAVVSRPQGILRPATFYVQGLIFDPGSAGSVPASVTNGILGVPVLD